jgi:hypothetical protein
MDIRTQRNLEKLFRLMDVKPVTIDTHIEIMDRDTRIFVEVRDTRVLLSAMTSVEPVFADSALRALLARWSPAMLSGVPLRACCIDDNVLVSSAMPSGSGAELWYRVHRAQRRLLAACMAEEA